MVGALSAGVVPLAGCALDGVKPLDTTAFQLEMEIARRVRADSASVAPGGLQSIAGPFRFAGRLIRAGEAQPESAVCRIIVRAVDRYWNQSAGHCASWLYSGSSVRRTPVYLVDYVDRYPASEEYKSFSGHLAYRAPFSAEPGLISYDRLCGEFVAFDLVANHVTYRVVVANPNVAGSDCKA